MKIRELCKLAEKVASKSPCRYKVSCILVGENGEVVATGYNHHCTTGRKMGKPTVHAEMDALSKVRKPSRNLTAFIYRKKGKIITPCKACQSLLDAYEINCVWHTAGREGEGITIVREKDG
jgi:deoxycytidylate deaminase